MSEFTGERVVPGWVNDDLWAEHIARYAFAARFAAGKKTLDAGCGAGYGAGELVATGAKVIGIDAAAEAVEDARRYCDCSRASVAAMPFRNGSFDLVVAFEVIEHLTDWRTLLSESRRVLTMDGLMIVSTPNRAYYTESRGTQGPNPYHVHEFDFEEFRDALLEFFPSVQILMQNRVESFVFYENSGKADATVASGGAPEDANFFIALCGKQTEPARPDFVYVPRAANLLRERERHIRKLELELAQTKAWLDEQIQAQVELQRKHESLTLHLEQQNRWALDLQTNWNAAQERVAQLQDELKELQETADRRIKELEAENRASVEWATQLDARLGEKAEQVAATVRLLDTAEATVVERTQWAQRLDKELAEVRAQLALTRESRWMKLGRAIGAGPKL